VGFVVGGRLPGERAFVFTIPSVVVVEVANGQLCSRIPGFELLRSVSVHRDLDSDRQVDDWLSVVVESSDRAEQANRL